MKMGSGILGSVAVASSVLVHLSHKACVTTVKIGTTLEGRDAISRVMGISNRAAMSMAEALMPKLVKSCIVDVVDGVVVHLKTLFGINLMMEQRDEGLCEGLPILIKKFDLNVVGAEAAMKLEVSDAATLA